MRWWLVQRALYDQDSQAQDAAVHHRRLDAPMEAGLFYTMGIVFRADVITHLIEQFPGVVPSMGNSSVCQSGRLCCTYDGNSCFALCRITHLIETAHRGVPQG